MDRIDLAEDRDHRRVLAKMVKTFGFHKMFGNS
jgi:hypothetical protein